MTFWGGSGSGSSDPCFWLMDLDPAIFVIDLQHASKKLIFNTVFSSYYFLKVYLHHFSKRKSQKESQNRRNQGFSYYFCMMIEGSGSIPLTSGAGSWRPKNMWIRWIRIRNTPFPLQRLARLFQGMFSPCIFGKEMEVTALRAEKGGVFFNVDCAIKLKSSLWTVDIALLVSPPPAVHCCSDTLPVLTAWTK
jgi:hypothetical protein